MTKYDHNDYELVQKGGPICGGCAFSVTGKPWCLVVSDDRFDCLLDDRKSYIFVKREK